MDFYDNLTGDGVFFFWIAIVIALFLVGLAIFLLLKNRKLSTILKDEKKVVAYPVDNDKEETIDIIKNTEDTSVEIAPVKEEKEPEILQTQEKEEPEVLQIENKKEEVKEPELLQIDNQKEEAVEIKEDHKVTENKKFKHDIENKFKFSDDDIPKLFEPSKEVKKEEKPTGKESPKPYQKNVLREISRKMPISPIHIEKEDKDEEIYTVSDDTEDSYDLADISIGEDIVSPLEKMEDNYEANDDMKEIVSRMEEEVKPSNIELTEYEKKQEEEAIISYDELQKVKDKIYNLTEEEEDGEFIDELKNFRSDLE